MGVGDWLKGQLRIAVKSNLRSLKHGGTVSGVMAERAKIKDEDRRARDEAQARALGRPALMDVSRRAFREAQAQKGRDIQYEDGAVVVKVKNGYDRTHDAYVSDIVVVDKMSRTEHYHVVYDEQGSVLHEKWTQH